MEGEKQHKKQYDWLKAHQWKKGQSGNPKGRPPGKSLKTFVKEMLEDMPDEEKVEFLKTLPADLIWKMAEGNPKQDTDVTSDGEKIIIMPTEVIAKNNIDAGNPVSQDTSGSSEG